MNTIIRTLRAKNGHIYKISGGRRIEAASCSMRIEIQETTAEIPILGTYGGVKRYKIALIFPYDINQKADVDGFAHTSIEIEADVERSDGRYERMFFNDIKSAEFDTSGEWEFETDDIEVIRKLLEM